ncbi:MAG: glycosyltransferase family 2 protein [Phycisphaeraceae bacterium]
MPRPVVVVPTYENGRTVVDIVRRVLDDGWRCVVVDDGSRDGSHDALTALREAFGGERLDVIKHDRNRGKAAAMQTGFDAASAHGTHAITLDADGQHDPEQIALLWDAALADPESIVLGERPWSVEGGTPLRSRLGRRVSNALVWLQSGLEVADSQTGFRVYPLAMLERIPCQTARFAFETEILIRAARCGVTTSRVPIRSRYLPRDARVSHFKPLRDSVHSLSMQVGLIREHPLLTRTLRGWLRHQVLYLPLFLFLLIGVVREGLSPEAQWHPAFLAASISGLAVLALWRRLSLGYEPVPAACLIFLFFGTFGVLMKGTGVYEMIHSSYGSLKEVALLLWVAGVCLVLAVVRPAWLLGVGQLPRPSARYGAWLLAGVSVVAAIIAVSLHGAHTALAGAMPFVMVLLAQSLVRRRALS